MLCQIFRPRSTGILLLCLLAPPLSGGAESAKKLYKQGLAAQQKGDLETAYRAFGLALDKEPSDIRYKLALEKVKPEAAAIHVQRGEQLQKQEKSKEALIEFFRALEIDPGNALAEQEIEKTKAELDRKDKGAAREDGPAAEDLDRPGPPVHLDAVTTDPITLNMTEDSRVLYQTIGKVAGLSVLIDPDFPSKRVTINVKNVTVEEALGVLGDLSSSFWKASTHNTIYVAQNTRAKRQQLEQLAVKTFYLSNASQQSDLNDVVTTLRNVLAQEAKLFAVAGQNAIVVRGTLDEILLAKQLIASLDLPKPEVLVDVYIMEVRREKVRNMGFSPPTSLSITANNSTTSTTLNQLGRSSSYSYSIGQAAAEMYLTDSDTRILQNPSIRAVDGQKASLKIGLRIPIATGSFTTATSASASSVQTQFQYIDTGVTVEITPTIHEDRDVTMKLGVEISSQDGQSIISGVTEPIISQQKAEQVIRLKDGEVSILAGLMQDELTHTVGGWPGVGELPGLKYMFSTQETDRLKDELIFMLVPHVVREFEGNTGAARAISTGSSDSIRINRIATPPSATTPSGTPR